MRTTQLRLAALLCLAFFFPLNSFSEINVFSAGVFARGLELRAVPAAPVPHPGLVAPAPAPSGDFSRFPAYSFDKLNELNTGLIDASGRSVDIAIFSITIKDNPDALIRAVNRGVRVRMIIDEAHVYPKQDPQITRLIQEKGVEVRTLRGTWVYGVNHNKIGVYGGSAAATGSYNWTYGATFSNYENTVITRVPAYVDGYSNYFEWMWSKARTLKEGPSPELPGGYYGTPPQDPSPALSFNGTPVPAYLFSPGSNSEGRLAAILDSARKSLDIVTFTFSSRVLADAVVRAHKRGVKIRFMMDTNMAKTSVQARDVFNSGVEFRWRRGRTEKGALHDKFAILDGKLLETGSFNWTANASINSFENIIFLDDTAAIKAYQAVYDGLYEGATVPSAGDFQPAAAAD